jgi:hypothetical protein
MTRPARDRTVQLDPETSAWETFGKRRAIVVPTSDPFFLGKDGAWVFREPRAPKKPTPLLPPFLRVPPPPILNPWKGPNLPEPRYFRRELGPRAWNSADVWSLVMMAFFAGLLFRPIVEGMCRLWR